MSSAAEEIAETSFHEYLEHEQRAERRHEYVGGRVYVMAGGSERHDLVSGLVYEALAPGARRRGCRPFTANRLLDVGGSGYYPDVLVVCGPSEHRLYEADANLVVEVLSPSTAGIDRREKASAYARLAGLDLYVVIDPDRRRVEVARSHDGALSWRAYGPGEVVTTACGDLDVDALHDTVGRTATS